MASRLNIIRWTVPFAFFGTVRKRWKSTGSSQRRSTTYNGGRGYSASQPVGRVYRVKIENEFIWARALHWYDNIDTSPNYNTPPSTCQTASVTKNTIRDLLFVSKRQKRIKDSCSGQRSSSQWGASRKLYFRCQSFDTATWPKSGILIYLFIFTANIASLSP